MAEQRRVVLTGVSRGLGLVLAEGLIAAGHTVYGCARNQAQVTELSERFGAPHQFRAVNVCQAADVNHWAAEVLAAGGPPDLLINNAAIINRNAPLWQVPAEEFDRVMDINVKGVANVLRAFLPAMVQRQAGVIVNLSSGWGRSTSPEVAPYCASKYAIEGLTKALAQELPAGMAAVPLNPGVINTDMLQSCFEGAEQYQTPGQWVKNALPLLLGIGPANNGESMTVRSATGIDE